MDRNELRVQLDKLQRKWQCRAGQHRAKMEVNSPTYDAYDHGVATGYLKAITTFKEYVSKLTDE